MYVNTKAFLILILDNMHLCYDSKVGDMTPKDKKLYTTIHPENCIPKTKPGMSSN